MNPEFAANYAEWESWHWWFRGRQQIMEEFLRRELPGATPRIIVAVGCGPSRMLGWLRPFAGTQGRVIGVDCDPIHVSSASPGITHIVADMQTVPLLSGSVDVALALDVLEHLEDDAAGLKETMRLLKPGGLLVVTVPAIPSLWGAQDELSHHRRRYTRATLLQAFERAQLPTPYLTFFNTFLFPVAAAIRWTRRALGLSKRFRPDMFRSDMKDNHPGPINEMLTAVFAAERHVVARVPMPVGVSLLATLRAA